MRLAKTLLLVLSLAMLSGTAVVASGCSFCTAELRAALYGAVIDNDGATVVPDSVQVAKDGRVEPCDVWDDGSYSCWERGEGFYTLRVTIGAEYWEWDLWVDADECHVDSREFDAVLVTP